MSAGAALEVAWVPSLTPARWLTPLADASEERTGGGKACTLARLMALGAPVPDGVVLTCDAFEALLGSPSIRDRIDAHLASFEDWQDPAAAAAGVSRHP